MFFELFQDLIHTPRELWIIKVLDRFKNLLFKSYWVKKDIEGTSFNSSSFNLRRWSFISNNELPSSYTEHESFSLIGKYIEHKFDILGNTWYSFAYQNISGNEHDVDGNWLSEIVNRSNLIRSKEIWAEIVKLNSFYHPIDWQLDPRSGYRFNSKLWYKNQLSDVPDNSEIKVPWELGRLQHVSRMLVIPKNDETEEKSLIEVQCQLLDFILSNPPRWGVNWRSTMDVAIRAANMSMTLNILVAKLPEFDSSTSCAIIKSSLLDHYYHILNNHERKNGLGNNHYLSNIVGLLYTAYAIDDEIVIPTINKYIEELFIEINKQFLPDGGNFESSSTYHALSTEMCVYGMALVDCMQADTDLTIEINKDEQASARGRLNKAFHFLEAIIYEDGTLPQLGDNDSGRFFKWTFHGDFLSEDEYKFKYVNSETIQADFIPIDEDYLNYSSVLNLCRGYFNPAKNKTFEGELIRSISGMTPAASKQALDNDIRIDPASKVELKYKNQTTIQIDDIERESEDENLKLHAFQETGVYILENDELKVIINGINCMVRQYWPHGHNDKLSFSVNYKGLEFFRDPGSYSYTGDSKLRNVYRSVKAHNSPNHGKEQNLFPDGKQGVFRLIPRSKVNVLDYTDSSIKLSLEFDDVVHHREWLVKKRELVITDESNKPFDSNFYPEIRYSNGYGKMLTEFA